MDSNKENNAFASFEMMLAKSAVEFDRKLEKSRTEFEQEMRKLRESQAETAEQMKETDRKMQETSLQMKETDRMIKALAEQVAGVTKSNGLFAEDHFFSAFEKDKLNFIGEKYDKAVRGKGTIVNDQYDFVLINGKTAGIVEVKYKARKDDIEQALKKPDTFRVNFPEYKNHKIYLAIAALTIDATFEHECKKNGIAVIKQVGDKLVVNDKNLKVF